MRYSELIDKLNQPKHSSQLDEIFCIKNDDHSVEVLLEERWVTASNKSSIRIDPPHYEGQQKHAHIYGRRGDEIGAINVDGTSSHGSKFKLTKAEADAIEAQGFTVPDDRIVEWIIVAGATREMLFG